MQYTQADFGRVYILRLESGDRLPDVIEEFAVEQEIKAGLVMFLGGAEEGSKVIVGPEDGKASKPIPLATKLPGVCEAVGWGTIFKNEAGKPQMHMHAAFGRQDMTITGCTRAGVDIWHIGEVVLLELLNTQAQRRKNAQSGFELLEISQY